jgi:competence protein ComGC
VTIQLETLRRQHEAFVVRHEDMINQSRLEGHQRPESDEKYVLELQAKAQAVRTLESQAEEMAAEFRLKEDEMKQDLERLKRELIAEENSRKDLEGTLEKVRTEVTLLEAQLGQTSGVLTRLEQGIARLKAIDKDRSDILRKAQAEGDAVSCEIRAIQLMVDKLMLAVSMEERQAKNVKEVFAALKIEVEALSKVEAECESFQREWQKEQAERIRLQLRCDQLEIRMRAEQAPEVSKKGTHEMLADVENQLHSAQLEMQQQAATLMALQKEGDLLHSALDKAESAAEKHKKESEALGNEVRECRKQLDEAMIEKMEANIHTKRILMEASDEKYVLDLQAKDQAVQRLESQAEEIAAEFRRKEDEMKQDLERLKRALVAEIELNARIEKAPSYDSEIQSALAREQEKNSSLEDQLALVQEELHKWCNGNGAGAREKRDACKASEEMPAVELSQGLEQDMWTQGRTLSPSSWKSNTKETAQVEALRREIEETDEALRCAETRIIHLETQLQEEREQSEMRINKLCFAQNQSLLIPHHGQEAAGLLLSHPQTASGQHASGKQPAMGTIAESDDEWEDASLPQDEGIVLLTGLLKQKEERNRDVERLQMRIIDKDSTIHVLEVQLAHTYDELNKLQAVASAQAQELTLLQANQAAASALRVNGGVSASPNAVAGGGPTDGHWHLVTLCDSLVQIFSSDPLVLNPEDPTPAGGKSKTTVGLVFRNISVEDLVAGGPAHSCQRIHRGDVLTSINGQAVTEGVGKMVGKLITGDDLVGSCVKLGLKKLTGVTFEIVLTRIQNERAHCRRKVYELLQSLRQSAVASRYALPCGLGYFVCAYARLLNNGCHRAGFSHGDSPHGGMLAIVKTRGSHLQTHSQAL